MNQKLPSQKVDALAALKRIACVSALCLALVSVTMMTYAQAELIKDLNVKEQPFYIEYSRLTDGNGVLYFITHKKELWRSDGTSSGTTRIKALKSISSLTMVGSVLYFVGDDGTGPELWRSNGTTAVTTRVKDIRPGSLGSNPRNLTDVNGTLYFVANDGRTGEELWKSNGSQAGTVLVKDIFAGGGSGKPFYLTNVNGTLYFSAYNNSYGTELWKSDGTASGTVMVKDIYYGQSGSHPFELTSFNGMVYFSANETIAGRELWRSDGTAAGTVLVKDARPGRASSHARSLTVAGNSLYFFGYGDEPRGALWKSDGTPEGTVILKTIDATDPGVYNLKGINDYLYFTADHNGYHVWRSDGTIDGTIPIMPISNEEGSSPLFTSFGGKVYFYDVYYDEDYHSAYVYRLFSMNPDGTQVRVVWEMLHEENYDNETSQWFLPELVASNNYLYFFGAEKPGAGFKLLKWDGTRTSVVKDVYVPTNSSNPANFINVNDNVFFTSGGEGLFGDKYLWRTNGTREGTVMVKAFSYIQGIEKMNGDVYAYVSTDAYDVNELWKISGTDFKPTLVKRLPHGDYVVGSTLKVINKTLFFYNEVGELWKSDGTTTGTVMLKGFHQVVKLYTSGNTAYLLTNSSAGVQELWKTNGTVGGTVKVKTIRTTGQDSYNEYPHATIGNIFYFAADDGAHGLELWRSDGTASGTFMVTDLRTENANEFASDFLSMTAFEGNLYFSAKDAQGNFALFKSDGTAAGTQKILNVPQVNAYISYGNNLLFFAEAGHAQFYRLWSTDGTTAGTMPIKDLIDIVYISSALPVRYEQVNNVLYFATHYADKLWRTDGTSCGTFPVETGLSKVSPIESIGNTLILGGYASVTYGKELYRYNLSNAPVNPCGETIAARAATTAEEVILTTGEEQLVQSAPNPFINDFSIEINSQNDSYARVNVFNSSGVSFERMELACNTQHHIGRTWPSGFYILNIEVEGKIISKKMIKK